MYPAEKRLGFLVPPANWTVEKEIPRYLPDGVTVNFNRLSRTDHTNQGEGRKVVSKDNLNIMSQSLGRAAIDMAEASPDVIVYCCTSGSFVNGAGRQQDLSDRITALTGCRGVTTSAALIDGLRAVGAGTVFLATPYPDDINELEVEFLTHYGFGVPRYDSLRCINDDYIRKTPPSAVFDLIMRNVEHVDKADAIFISCTNLQSMDQIENLEEATGKPVLTSNQVSLWAALKAIGIPSNGKAPGRLFKAG